jgi:tetratricopeptide (TPR) repeat protein
MCHAQAKEWAQAIANLKHAVQLDPEQRLYVHSLGFCLARDGKFDESCTVFAKVDGEATAHYNIARMLHHMQQDEKAIEHLQLSLKAKADFSPAEQMLKTLETPGTAAAKDEALDVIQKTN